MARGAFDLAWRLSDAALPSPDLHNPAIPRHQQRIWSGMPLDGRRVLVRCYHGLGDTLQFIRYVPLVKRVARRVDVWAQPPLLPLLRSIPSIDTLLPLHDGVVDLDFDVDVEVMELPHVFRTTLNTLPAAIPYLRAPRLLSARRAAAPALEVGLAWQAGGWDPHRSIPFELVRPLIAVPGIGSHALQETLTQAEERTFPRWRPRSLLDLAAHVSALDLVITVDTMVAHLAGALGVRTWLLLHAAPDWRWMRGRADTPWYPTIRLYRQEQPGDWPGVIAQVRQDLERLSDSTLRGTADA